MKTKVLLLFLLFTSISVLVRAQYVGVRICPGYSSFYPKVNNINALNDGGNFSWEAGFDLGFKSEMNNKIKEHIFSFSYINNYGGSLLYDEFYSWEFWRRSEYTGSGIFYNSPIHVNYTLNYLSFSYRSRSIGAQGVFWELSPTITYLLNGTGELSTSSNSLNNLDISKDLQKINILLGLGVGMDFSSYNVPITLSINYHFGITGILKNGSNYYRIFESTDQVAEDKAYLQGRIFLGIVYILFNKTN